MTTPKISRLADEPMKDGKHAYRCNACGEVSYGHDRDREHLKWRERHWAKCYPSD